MSQKRKKLEVDTSSTLLNYISIKPKMSTINEPPSPQKLFTLLSPSTSDIVGNYEKFSSLDISLFVNKKLNDKQKIEVLQNVRISDNSYNFPNQQIGNKKRKFNIVWLTKYK